MRDHVACREPECHDDVDLRIGFQSIEGRVQCRYAPIAVQPRSRRDGQRETVAIDFRGCMLESVRAQAFSRFGAIDEDTDAYLARQRRRVSRVQD
jgi:hypothetical protein